MKSFTVHSFLLMMVLVIVGVYAASIRSKLDPLDLTLRYIYDEAQAEEDKVKNGEKHERLVAELSVNDTKCPVDFFCLAQKVLEKQADFKNSSLFRYMRQYNRKAVNHTCTRKTHSRYNLTVFLEDVQYCADTLLHLKE